MFALADVYTIQGAVTGQPPGTGVALPAWMLATQRSMERSVADLADVRPSPHLDPARAGASRALEFITKAIKRSNAGTSVDAMINRDFDSPNVKKNDPEVV